jgi:hypothetical protein
MKAIHRVFGGLFAVAALIIVAIGYSAHAVRGSDHQDTFNLANRSNTSADITDVYVFPSPANPANVVLAMNVFPLIPAGLGPTKFFDPTLIWQLKISHQSSGIEDQVIQFSASGTTASQVISVYGPAKPNEIGTSNTLVPLTGNVPYNTPATLSNGVQAFAGPRADPFFFDLFAFFSFLGDRNASAHTSQNDPGTGDTLANSNNVGAGAAFGTPGSKTAKPATPSFAGFGGGTLSGPGGYACRTDLPAQNALADLGGGFNVLSLVVEVPKALLTTGFSSPVIHVWATANSSTGS